MDEIYLSYQENDFFVPQHLMLFLVLISILIIFVFFFSICRYVHYFSDYLDGKVKLNTE